ncbi:MAG: efflux transporter outer membrane subunit [Nitrococcus sp.]|nr:efflux transporter outer membrane subunit [Nitrococcus sp.]
MQRIARLIAFLPVLMLNACMVVGPDFKEPEVTWLKEWRSDLYGQIGNAKQQAKVDLRFWWRLFNDPVLNNLIQTARRENPTLRVAGLRILESRALLGIAGSELYPQLQLSGALTRVNQQRNGGQIVDQNQRLTKYQATFGDAAWELDFWGRFRRGIESANATFFASIANQQDVQVLLSAQVADLYFAYRTTLLRIGVAQRNAAIQKRSFEITEKIYQSGQGSELDLQQAKTQYLTTLSTIPDLEATLIRIHNALGALLGRAPGDVPELFSVKGPLPEMDPVVIAGIPAQLLLRRPDIRRAALEIAAQSAQIGIAEADFYPTITLLGSIGWFANSLAASPETLGIAVGPSLRWNIFSFGRIRSNVRLQDARLQQTIGVFHNSVLQAAREIDNAAISVVKARERGRILSDSLRAAERSRQLATTRYIEGYANFQRVLTAQRVLFAQAELLVVNRSAEISAIIALYTAIGGGWVEMSVEQLYKKSVRDVMRTRTNWGDLLSAPLPASADGPLGRRGTENRNE